MTSHDACISGTSRVLTVAQLQRLNMEVFLVELVDCEVQSMIKFLMHRAQRRSKFIVSCATGQWSHTARRSRHHLQDFSWEVFNHPPYSPDLVPSDFHHLLQLKKFLSGQRQHFQNDREAEMSVTVVPIPGGRLLRHRIQNLVPRYEKVSIPKMNIQKNSSTLAVSVPVNVSIKLSFVFVNGPREIYFVDPLRTSKGKFLYC